MVAVAINTLLQFRSQPETPSIFANLDALGVLLEQFDVDTRPEETTALFGLMRQFNLAPVTNALLDAGADPALLLCSDECPPAVLGCVFERVGPKTLYPTAADILCRGPIHFENSKLVVLLQKHGYTISEVRHVVFSSFRFVRLFPLVSICLRAHTHTHTLSLMLYLSLNPFQNCLARLQARHWGLKSQYAGGKNSGPNNFVWMFYLTTWAFHCLLDSIPPAVVADASEKVQWCRPEKLT